MDVGAWRAEHAAANAPGLPDAALTVSTTRLGLPSDLAVVSDDHEGVVTIASDWNVQREHAHWPLIWLTVVSQAAVGLSLVGTTQTHRLVAAMLAASALVGAVAHLGRPAVAWKAVRNLRTSWLSREVVLLSAYAGLAAGAVVADALAPLAALVGVAGTFASAMLYVLPGRPAWHSWLTPLRFAATCAVLGGASAGMAAVAGMGAVVSLGAWAANLVRLRGDATRAARASVHLELTTLRAWSIARVVLLVSGSALLVTGGTSGLLVAGGVALLAGEVLGRWLFFVCVVPLDVPGSFWRGVPATAAQGHTR
jgi:DMSO reductase anchor subunit